MRHFTARRLALAALVPALFVLTVIPGCSNESEGERCGDAYGVTNNDDCQAPLVCTLIPLNGTAPVGRCCYTDHVTDSRCAITNDISATGSSAGAAATSDAGTTPSDAGAAGSSPSLTDAAGAGGAGGAAGAGGA